MAAVRSAMVRLSRRSCISGSSAAAPMGGRVMEISYVVRPAAPMTPLLRPAPAAPGAPPLRHSAVGNLENFQRLSTGKECADPKKSPLMIDKTGSVLDMLGRWSKDSLRNVREAEPTKVLCVSAAITSVTSIYLMATTIWSLKQSADASYGEFN
ncbi:unnamed protein product [Urochloa humidicola]